MHDNLLKYKIGISLISKIGPVTAKKLIAYTGGVEAVFKEKKTHLLKIPGIGVQLANYIIDQNVLERAEKETEFIAKYQIDTYFYLDKEYPERLKQCNDSPIMLFAKGDFDFNEAKVLSIVGTRNATAEGKEFCNNLLASLTERGHKILIVSGLAYGIDIAAHKAAIKHNQPTVGVLAHGMDTIYPSVHAATAREMVKNGGLVTEFLSGTKMDRNYFLQRNRIIAGMADATLVVESAISGGALVTADIANSYNRDVFAVPGCPLAKVSQGCNALIKRNKAALLESAEDLEYYMNWQIEAKNSKPVQKQLFITLSPDEEKIVEALKTEGKMPIDHICIHTDLPMAKVSATLLNLEFSGVVKCHPGKVFEVIA
jgi:DNA processing protein